jgi:hypothetical protein
MDLSRITSKLVTEKLAATMPKLSDNRGKGLMAYIKDRLAQAGLPQVSGEIAGIVPRNLGGHIGFAVQVFPTSLKFHVVVSGKKAGLQYTHYKGKQDGEIYELHDPIKPESLYGKISQAFKFMGFKVAKVQLTSFQSQWDDDITYMIETDFPPSL